MKYKLVLFFFFLSYWSVAQWTHTNGPKVGGVSSVVYSAGNLISSGPFGLFYSTDLGESWNHVYNQGPVLCLASSGQTVYAGTDGFDIHRSTDAGVHWTALSNPGSIIHCLVADGAEVFAAIGDFGVYHSTDNGNTWTIMNNGMTSTSPRSISLNGNSVITGTASNGIFVSSDRGVSWVQRNNGLTTQNVKVVLNLDSVLLAGTLGGGLFRSTDGGQNWQASGNGLSSLYIHSLKVYGNSILLGDGSGKIYISGDYGNNWNLFFSSPSSNASIPAIETVGANIYAAGLSGVLMSPDSGLTWNVNINGLGDADVISIAINSTRLYAGTSSYDLQSSIDLGGSYQTTLINSSNHRTINDVLALDNFQLCSVHGYGVYRSTNNFGFYPTNVGLNTGYIYKLVQDSTHFFAVGYGGIRLSVNDGITWTDISNNIGSTNVYDIAARDSFLVAATDSGLSLSTDFGANWTRATSGLPLSTSFWSVVLKGNKIFAGCGSGIYSSDDGGINWIAVNNGLQSTYIKVLEVHDSVLFTSSGFTTGICYMSRDDGANWININDGLPEFEVVKSIAFTDSMIYAGTGCSGLWQRKLNDLTGIDVLNKKNSFTLFPNPATNEIKIRVNDHEKNIPCQLILLSIYGQELLSQYFQQGISDEETIALPELPSGIYLLQLRTGRMNITQKFLVEQN